MFDAQTRTFSRTPPQDFNGQIVLKVTASDGQYSVSDSFVLNINAVNDAPTADADGPYSVDQSVLLTDRRCKRRAGG